MPLSLNHDAAWHFQTAFRILAGDRLGNDVFDINPPMSAWLFLLPALAVNATGLPPATVFKLFTIAICAVGYLISLNLLGRIVPSRARWLVAVALGGVLFVMPGYDFAQREHLVTAMVLPYVFLAILRERGDDLGVLPTVLIGLLAAVAICIKPYFVALPLSIELSLLLRRGSLDLLLRRENMMVAAVGVAYLAAVAVFAPDYYLRVVPDALASYDGLESTWTDVLVGIAQILAPSLASLLLVLLVAGRRSLDGATLICLAAALGFLVAALLQKKGWTYQLYPITAFVLIAAACAYAMKDVGRPVDRTKIGAAMAMALWALTAAPVVFLADGYASQGTTARVAQLRQIFMRHAAPAQSVYAFITSPRDIHPAVLESERPWAGASGAMLYLPAVLNADGEPDLEAIEVAERERNELFTRLAWQKPAIIAVDNKMIKLGIADRNFDYLEYFAQFPQFRTLWADYREVAGVAPFRIFIRDNTPQSASLSLTQTAARPASAGNR